MKLKRIAVAAMLVGGFSSAMALTTTMSGTNFDISFENTGLFGTPTIVGNSIVWSPSSFAANTTSDMTLVNSTFSVTITAKNNLSLNSFSLTEAGDYSYFGTGNGVAAGGELRVTNLVGTPSTQVSDIMMAGSTMPNATVVPFPTQKWNADAMVSMSTTKATAQVQNLLAAWASDTTALDYAFIQKKNIVLEVGMVPEPETYAMMLAGLGALGFLASRRRNR